jgi:hypothetical protein
VALRRREHDDRRQDESEEEAEIAQEPVIARSFSVTIAS